MGIFAYHIILLLNKKPRIVFIYPFVSVRSIVSAALLSPCHMYAAVDRLNCEHVYAAAAFIHVAVFCFFVYTYVFYLIVSNTTSHDTQAAHYRLICSLNINSFNLQILHYCVWRFAGIDAIAVVAGQPNSKFLSSTVRVFRCQYGCHVQIKEFYGNVH